MLVREQPAAASELKPAPASDQWIGEQALSYRIDVGGEGDTEFLLGNWGPTHGGSRDATNGSSIRLPFSGKEGAVATLHFSGPTNDVKNLQLSSLGKLIAGAASRKAGYEELLWALLTSTEFVFKH